MTSSSPGSQPNESILLRKVFLDSRPYYKSLEPYIDFLAILVAKLWPNLWKLIREVLKFLKKFLKYLKFFGITLELETLESRSSAPKTCIIA